jgi:7,8-dihydro-6-hydroxymethylpterin-pyrophosphokinase
MSVKERIYQLVDSLPEDQVLNALEDLERQQKQTETPKTGIRALDAALVKMGQTAPREEREIIPTDFSEQHDHYIYGTPKR